MSFTQSSQVWLLNQSPEGKIGNLFFKSPQTFKESFRCSQDAPFLHPTVKAGTYWYGVVQGKAGLLGGKWTQDWVSYYLLGVFYKNPFPPNEVNGLGLKCQRSPDTIILRSQCDPFTSKCCQHPSHILSARRSHKFYAGFLSKVSDSQPA